MSGDSSRNSNSTASEIEVRAAAWIERREFGDWKPADQAELGDWLDQSLAHRVAYDRLDLGWQHAGRLTALRQAKSFSNERTSEKNGGAVFRKLTLFVAAASTAAAVLVGWRMSGDSEITYVTSMGGREVIRV